MIWLLGMALAGDPENVRQDLGGGAVIDWTRLVVEAHAEGRGSGDSATRQAVDAPWVQHLLVHDEHHIAGQVEGSRSVRAVQWPISLPRAASRTEAESFGSSTARASTSAPTIVATATSARS